MNIYEKMQSGELYNPSDTKLLLTQFKCLGRMHRFNKSHPLNIIKRNRLLKKMLAEVGEGCYITPPFYANWAGKHLHLGKGVYANTGLTIVDDTHIYVGDYTQFGPNVIIASAGHPILPSLRSDAPLQYNIPVRIGNNCWIGAGAVIVPGITIGDNTVIGAGSVVVKDIPSNVVAVGNPCHVIREIGEHDAKYYYKDKEIDLSQFDPENK